MVCGRDDISSPATYTGCDVLSGITTTLSVAWANEQNKNSIVHKTEKKSFFMKSSIFCHP